MFGIIELLLVILLIAAIFGRPHLALGAIFDFVIALLVIGLIWRIALMIL
ncbi:MAG: hypothetical protein WDZ94_02510 [Patescibacteria group bacterium]